MKYAMVSKWHRRNVQVFALLLTIFVSVGDAFISIQQRHCFRDVNIQVKPQHTRRPSLHKHHLSRNEKDPLDENIRAYPQQTPHSGRHFSPTHPAHQPKSRMKRLTQRILNRFSRHPNRVKTKRFMEGWYYRLTLPEENISFAFIFSIEDPNPSKNGELALSAVQVMGPNDEYVVQSDPDHRKFWAWQFSQAFGCVFDYNDDDEGSHYPEALPPDDFHEHVKSGFQMLPDRLQGKVDGHDGSLGGVSEGQGLPRTCDFDLKIRPLSGWGDDEDGDDVNTSRSQQKATAGWLASYSVFEPHWQVTMADARATGFATWNGKRYDFVDAPFYAEKNWGGSFPSKWYWVQCNSFEGFTSPDGSSRLSLTAGGGIRKVPFGKTEDLGMVCVHHNGIFYEAVPWTGDMEWDVDPWGSWSFSARCTSGKRLFEIEVQATCDEEGVALRAPTSDLGLVYFCRDSFYSNIELSLYELAWDSKKKEYVRGDTIIKNAKSINKTGAVEIGGGPYWNPWKGKSKMRQPLKTLVQLPYLLRR
jgi:tocopherol cyclase